MQILSYFNWRRILITVLCLLVYLVTIAQFNKRVNVTHAQTVDVVTGDQIQEFKVANLTDVVRIDPGTHKLKSRTVTYDYNSGPFDKTVQEVQYNRLNEPAYTVLKTFDQGGSLVRALEELRVNGDITQGYQWFGDRKLAFLYNDQKDKYEPSNFTAQWQPQINYVPDVTSEINWQSNPLLDQRILEIRSASPGMISLPDKTYGNNGKAELSYSSGADVRISEKKIYDARGVVREYHYVETYPDDFLYEEITYFDCTGAPVFFESTLFDDDDYELEAVRMQFINGQPVAGYHQVDDFDGEFRHYYNPATGQFEYMPGSGSPNLNYVFNLSDQVKPCDLPDHIFSLGPRLILEDSYPERFSTFGGYLQYTYLFSDKIGATVDLGYTTGSQYNYDYSKINILGGATYFPFDCLALDDEFSFSVHALAGLSSLTSKHEYSGMSYKNKSSCFTVYAGLDGYYNFNPGWGVKLSADYNPNFQNGNTTNNYMFSLGASFRF